MSDESFAALPEKADIVVIGGGFAGAATACFLAELGARSVVLFEAEEHFGTHASGLNAAIARQLTADPLMNEVLRASVVSITSKSGFATDVKFEAHGSLLLVASRDCALVRTAEESAPRGLKCEVLGKEEAAKIVPVLKDANFSFAVWTASDGIVDVHALLWKYLSVAKAKGVHALSRVKVTGIEVVGGRIRAVRTERGRVSCGVIVNAAGAWANEVAQMAGIDGLRMRPYRRHLMVTPTVDFVQPFWPIVWDVEHEYYFRPEVGGLLLSPGDEEPVGEPRAVRDPRALELLAKKLGQHCPALAGVPVARFWAGLRTIAEDRRFAVGWDRRVEGLFWVAGLGGHGVTGSHAIGEFAAREILGLKTDDALRKGFDPMRLV